ncbi:hypothetical protein K2X30_14645 [bacterium]|jgi:hypothetical protein|nr:hypothetical protein [bacterium]
MKYVKIFLILSFVATFSSCEVPQDPNNPGGGVSLPPIPGPSPVAYNLALPSSSGQCFEDQFTQPSSGVTTKTDILFVVDPDVNQGRTIVAEFLAIFMATLDGRTDYRFAVMLAQGPQSVNPGTLYQAANEPKVLSSDQYSVFQNWLQLRYKLTHSPANFHGPTDPTAADGMYALARSLEPDRLAEIRSQGFYRDNAALSVIFLSRRGTGCVSSDPNSFCGGVDPATLALKLRQIKGYRPLVTSGIVYPGDFTNWHSGNDDVSTLPHAWIPLLQATNGVLIDFRWDGLIAGLQKIGALLNQRVSVRTEFPLTKADIDPTTITVKVDGAMVPYSYSASTNQVMIAEADAGAEHSLVAVDYCLKVVETDPLVSLTCKSDAFVPKPQIKIALSVDPNEGSLNVIRSGFQSLGFNATYYSDADILAGKLINDGITVLVIARKVTLQPETQEYVDAVRAYIQNGGSLIGEYDGAAIMFNGFDGNSSIIPNLTPSLELFTGAVAGGGALLPLPASTTHVVNPMDPLMQGVPTDFLVGLKVAFAVTAYDSDWLHPAAVFVSQGTNGLVPAGTYPSVLSGRCGKGRVAMFMMNYFQVMDQDPINQMVTNTLRWVTGN